MRIEQAAFYLSMSQSSFQRLVDDGVMPSPTKIRGMVVWDRRDLDDRFDDLKHGQRLEPRNSFDELLGVTDGKDG
ncbi:putative DNA-binding transcriptional regulator AlpA [Bradyrhizobium sp. LB12.1]|uniref:XRE family transcriptional regulator n=1 Tax=Bradyrhizobium sp. LB12.1 TaxID=3156327 RepID=UPI003395CBEE